MSVAICAQQQQKLARLHRRRVTSLRSVDEGQQSPLTNADREDVLGASARTAAGLAGGTGALHLLGAALGRETLSFFPSPELVVSHGFTAFLVAGGVFAGRQVLNKGFPTLREATQRANSTVLPNLSTLDILAVSLLSGCSEELFFRGGLLPLVAVDIRGALVAAVVFGALHLSGGRNLSFVAWATGVGLTYGILALQTNDVAAAAVAHTSCNFISAMYWVQADESAAVDVSGERRESDLTS